MSLTTSEILTVFQSTRKLAKIPAMAVTWGKSNFQIFMLAHVVEFNTIRWIHRGS
jgi:hypothetical protein